MVQDKHLRYKMRELRYSTEWSKQDKTKNLQSKHQILYFYVLHLGLMMKTVEVQRT